MFSLRFLLIFYSFFAICIDSVYLGKLSSIFSQASYDLPVNSVMDILLFNVTFRMSWYMERLLLISYVAKMQNFRKKYSGFVSIIGNQTGTYYLRNLSIEQSFATITLRSAHQTYPIEANLVDHLSENLPIYLTMYVTYYVRKDAVLKRSLQYWTNEMVEKGFIIKWWRDIVESKKNYSLLPLDDKKQIALTVAHFAEIFQVLFIGYTSGAIFLLLEFLYKWLDDRLFLTDKLLYLFNLLKPPKVKRIIKI